jgi:hypothetical protein
MRVDFYWPRTNRPSFLVDCQPEIVHLYGSRRPLARFLQEYLTEEAQVDTTSGHCPALLLAKVVLPEPDRSYEGSIRASTISEHFEFGRRDYGAIEKAKSWVDEAPKRRRRMDTGDILLTTFTRQPSTSWFQPTEQALI